jgi:hypothetical protein
LRGFIAGCCVAGALDADSLGAPFDLFESLGLRDAAGLGLDPDVELRAT